MISEISTMLSRLPNSAAGILFILFTVIRCTSPVVAQTNQAKPGSQLEPLHAGVRLYDFTGNLHRQTEYNQIENGPYKIDLIKNTETVLKAQFRNIFLLNHHFGFGYKAFTTVYIGDSFSSVGAGAIGGGPIARFYPLKSRRWQPYLQAGFTAGYDLFLGETAGQENGVRYRTGLRGGLNYKISNGLGLFFEIGPEWEYDSEPKLDAHALQINLGIELFRF